MLKNFNAIKLFNHSTAIYWESWCVSVTGRDLGDKGLTKKSTVIWGKGTDDDLHFGHPTLAFWETFRRFGSIGDVRKGSLTDNMLRSRAFHQGLKHTLLCDYEKNWLCSVCLFQMLVGSCCYTGNLKTVDSYF